MIRPVIFLNGFMHKQTALVKLFFYANDIIEQRLKDLSYVYYSRQYTCYYIRWRDADLQKIKKDLNGIAYINPMYLYSKSFTNKEKAAALQSDHNFSLQAVDSSSIVSIVIVNDKTYLKLPVPYKKVWVDFLIEIGALFEPKRCFWMVPGYANKKTNISHYFQEQGCRIRFRVKHNEKVLVHSRRNNYKQDDEVKSFIKVMTLQGAARRTIDNYASQIRKMKDYYEGKQMADISDSEIRDYLFFLREELSYSPSAQNIVVSAVKRFLLSLTEREFNAYQLPRPAKTRKIPKILEKEEIIALLKVDIYIKHKCMLFLLYSTGIRCGELVNLKVEDINFGSNIIIIKSGKGNKDRIVTLSEKIKDLLLSYLRQEQPNTYLFEGQRGGRYSTSSVQKMVKRAVLKAGIDRRVTPHMLRHSFATHLHDSGMDIRNIQMLLGHTSTKTTEIYTYVSKRDISKLKSPLDDLDV